MWFTCTEMEDCGSGLWKVFQLMDEAHRSWPSRHWCRRPSNSLMPTAPSLSQSWVNTSWCAPDRIFWTLPTCVFFFLELEKGTMFGQNTHTHTLITHTVAEGLWMFAPATWMGEVHPASQWFQAIVWGRVCLVFVGRMPHPLVAHLELQETYARGQTTLLLGKHQYNAWGIWRTLKFVVLCCTGEMMAFYVAPLWGVLRCLPESWTWRRATSQRVESVSTHVECFKSASKFYQEKFRRWQSSCTPAWSTSSFARFTEFMHQ